VADPGSVILEGIMESGSGGYILLEGASEELWGRELHAFVCDNCVKRLKFE